MRGRFVIFLALVAASASPVNDARAQFSPQGIIGGISRPIRDILGGHHRYYPRHRHHAARPAAREAAVSPMRESAGNGTARLGLVGPAAWPSAYEEVIGFSLWPNDYTARIHSRGFEVIADTINGRFVPLRSSARVATGASAKNDVGNGEVAVRCTDPGQASDKWPSTRLEQILQLTNTEHASLDKLQAIINQSASGLRSACQNAGELAAPDRLRALVQMVWMVRDGGIAVRTPLRQLYNSLNDAQKISMTGGSVETIGQASSGPSGNGTERQQQVCASRNIESAERLIREIEMKVRPGKDQTTSLENLHKVSIDMAKLLITSCVQPVSSDPSARLDAASDQLTTMNYAATNVQIALDDFYRKLSDAQRQRLDSSSR